MADSAPELDPLEELGWTKRDLAKRMGLHENTVYAWGDVRPVYASRFLAVMIKVRRFSDEVLE